MSQIFKMAHKKRASIFLTLPLTSHLMLSLLGLVQFGRNSDYMRQNSVTYKERTSMIRDMKSFHSCLFSVPIPYISPAIPYSAFGKRISHQTNTRSCHGADWNHVYHQLLPSSFRLFFFSTFVLDT